ncbi:capsular polysaccharide biosynthesis protein [Adhaeribacter aerolatus]|uniref:protein-tyrosine-phosphatase n=1 Tax=Adhaeribacter aerolatus TaxID=670289 RepID=A0A512AYV3_9BACT|nr:CpsB/CapC family capsule biosynthesis tyrosine phosphatase [Adhaeribacter aerolatus]GEO04880.1 capsular polysaccharide biosynthesis protein [Adhaeribacter aerolatus]
MIKAFKKFFRKDNTARPFAGIAVDMHSHLLPGLDDGAGTLEKSLEMIAALGDLGYRKLILTPHIMGDFYRNTPVGIREKLNLVSAAVKDKGWEMELACAAEYYLDEWFLAKVKADEPLLSFGDNYVLIETSYINEPFNFKEIIFSLKAAGYTPVLAHPERYTYLYNRLDALQEIHDLGVLFQVNLNSFSGYYSPAARKVAEKLVELKQVHFVGTDAHALRHLEILPKAAANPYFKKALALPLRNPQL